MASGKINPSHVSRLTSKTFRCSVFNVSDAIRQILMRLDVFHTVASCTREKKKIKLARRTVKKSCKNHIRE